MEPDQGLPLVRVVWKLLRLPGTSLL
jgi:hypothetical protein